MNNHPRFSHNHFYKYQSTHAHCVWAHILLFYARAQVNGGIAKPNWARKEIKQAAYDNRAPDLRWSPEGVPPPPPPVEPPQEGQDAAPLCAAAVAMHGPPPMSNVRPQSAACPTVFKEGRWQEEPTEETSYPNPGFHVSGNLWNLDIADRAKKPGPMASFIRHVTSMQSPTSPSYAATGRLPVTDVHIFEQNQDNVAAHQSYLEKLQFEHNTLRSWSNTVQDQIAGEAQQVHLQLMQMIQTMQHRNNPQPWAQAWAERSVQPPPRPAQQTSQPQAVPAKAAPAARAQRPTQSASSSSMGSAPVIVEPWAAAKQNQQNQQ